MSMCINGENEMKENIRENEENSYKYYRVINESENSNENDSLIFDDYQYNGVLIINRKRRKCV